MREEFEKLPEVAQVLSLTDGFDGNRYHSMNNHRTADWLNGAWYAFQEQQKKIDAMVKYIKELGDSECLIQQCAHDDLMQILEDGEYKEL